MSSPAAEVCIVCGSADTRDDALLRHCRDCSLAWTLAPIGNAAAVYDEGYFSGRGYDDYGQAAARRYEAELRLDWLRSVASPATLLEAGAAFGYFVEAARRAGIDARGVEVSGFAAEYARTHLGMPVLTGEFESVDSGTGFDVVCGFHVLEHVSDPARFLAAVRQRLAPGGLALVEVPNFGSALAERDGPMWEHLHTEYHHWHFAPSNLARLFDRAGFDVINCDTLMLRAYMPPRFRRRQGRHRFYADVATARTLRLSHPTRGELLRLVARRPMGPA